MYHALIYLYDNEDKIFCTIALKTNYFKGKKMDYFVDKWILFNHCKIKTPDGKYKEVASYFLDILTEEQYNQLLVKDVDQVVFIDKNQVNRKLSFIWTIDSNDNWQDD